MIDDAAPEMEAMRKPVTVMKHPGEFHGFYWGQGRIPPLAKKANRDADAYLRKRIKVQPKPIDGSLAEWVEPQAPHALAALVEVYEPAIPHTPKVSTEGALREAELFPSSRPRPDLSGVDLATHVDNRFAKQALAESD